MYFRLIILMHACMVTDVSERVFHLRFITFASGCVSSNRARICLVHAHRALVLVTKSWSYVAIIILSTWYHFLGNCPMRDV